MPAKDFRYYLSRGTDLCMGRREWLMRGLEELPSDHQGMSNFKVLLQTCPIA